ncbi:hypothetical protein IWX47DRAFT_878781 [Phyllosticta citricarpa]
MDGWMDGCALPRLHLLLLESLVAVLTFKAAWDPEVNALLHGWHGTYVPSQGKVPGKTTVSLITTNLPAHAYYPIETTHSLG